MVSVYQCYRWEWCPDCRHRHDEQFRGDRYDVWWWPEADVAPIDLSHDLLNGCQPVVIHSVALYHLLLMSFSCITFLGLHLGTEVAGSVEGDGAKILAVALTDMWNVEQLGSQIVTNSFYSRGFSRPVTALPSTYWNSTAGIPRRVFPVECERFNIDARICWDVQSHRERV